MVHFFLYTYFSYSTIHPVRFMVNGIGMTQICYQDVYVYEYLIICVAWFGRVQESRYGPGIGQMGNGM